jgi:nucleotide-binding universal stress UspA family protein
MDGGEDVSGTGKTRIVAGYDGSHASQIAVRWAADEAARRGVPLAAVHAVDRTGLIDAPYRDSWVPDAVLREAQRTAEAGAAIARDREPRIEVTAQAATDSAAQALVQESVGSGLVVVGTRGRGKLAASTLGSVATAVSAHAYAPVVVVRGGEAVAPGPDRPVVVGVDGSPAAADALRFAVDAAQAAGATLKIVGAWLVNHAEWTRAYWLATNPADDPQRAANLAAERVVREAADAAAELAPSLKVQTYVHAGDPATVIVDLAGDDAALVVVGSRGRGALAGMVLGSVGHGVVHAARCPVAVVKERIAVAAAAGEERTAAGAAG